MITCKVKSRVCITAKISPNLSPLREVLVRSLGYRRGHMLREVITSSKWQSQNSLHSVLHLPSHHPHSPTPWNSQGSNKKGRFISSPA